MKTYLAALVGALCFAATAQAQTLADLLADFVGDWTYTRGIIEAYTPDGELADRLPMAGRTYTFKKKNNRIAVSPQGGGTTLTHKLEGAALVLSPEKQKKCLDTEDGYCCSLHLANTYTMINNQLKADLQYGFICDGVVQYVFKIVGTLVKGSNDTDKREPMGVSVTDALKADCPNGGVVINQGIDANGNGKIDTDEITSSEKVCTGVNQPACTAQHSR